MQSNQHFPEAERRVAQQLGDPVAAARQALVLCDDLIQAKLCDYRDRCLLRSVQRRPVLALLGYGRAGKDMAAEWLAANYQVTHPGSTSRVVLPLVSRVLMQPQEELYARRHEDRAWWFDFCNALRQEDPTLLARMALAEGDVAVGLRAAPELESVIAAGVVNLAVWIDNPRVPPDPTVEFLPEDCHTIVQNQAGKLIFFDKLRHLADALGLKPRKELPRHAQSTSTSEAAGTAAATAAAAAAAAGQAAAAANGRPAPARAASARKARRTSRTRRW